jgi:hypothetical protein
VAGAAAGGTNGEIAEGVLPELLRSFYVERRSGTLHLVRGEEQQSLRFRRGHIVNATTNVKEDRLGEMLVRRGHLTEADLARATEVVVSQKRRLGEVLAELGLLDKDGLEDAIALHAHEVIARLFTWQDGLYAFRDEPEEEAHGEVTLKLSTGELILEAVRAVKDPDVVRYALGDIDRVLAVSSDPLLRFQKLNLSPADGFVLSRVDGVTSARELMQMIPLPPEECQRSLFGLLSTGAVQYMDKQRRAREIGTPAGPAPDHAPAVERAEPAAPAPEAPAGHPAALPVAPAGPPSSEPAGLPLDAKAEERRREILDAWEGLGTRNHFEVLGLQRAVTETEVKDAYFRLAKRFHPDVHHGASLADLRDKLEAVFIRLGQAYDTLRDPKKRADYEDRLGRFRPRGAQAPPSAVGAQPQPAEPVPTRDPEEEARLAEQSLHKAAKLLETARALEQEKPNEPDHQRLTFDAIQLLEPAVLALTGKQKLRARLLLARGYAKNPKWAKRAEELLLDVAREHPREAEPFALLATIYAARGLKARVLAMYRKVLELKPDHEEAGRYVAENAGAEPQQQPPEGGGGLLGRLFRKG